MTFEDFKEALRYHQRIATIRVLLVTLLSRIIPFLWLLLPLALYVTLVFIRGNPDTGTGLEAWDPLKLAIQVLQELDQGRISRWAAASLIFLLPVAIGVLARGLPVFLLLPEARRISRFFQQHSRHFAPVARAIVAETLDRSRARLQNMVNNGSEVVSADVLMLQKALLLQSRPKEFFMTTLKPVRYFDSYLRSLTEDFLNDVKKTSSKLIRVVVCENPAEYFSLAGLPGEEAARLRWFVQAHQAQNVRLLYARADYMQPLAATHNIESTKLDVLLFGSRILLGLVNREDLGDLNTMTLFIVQRKEVLRRYLGLFKSICHTSANQKSENCGEVEHFLLEQGWGELYNLEDTADARGQAPR